jgi:hypothetical protein
MKRHKIYVTNRSRVSLVCPHCGMYRPVSVTKVRVLGKPVKARCTCGQSFVVEFERRNLHRKAISLPGSFRKPDSTDLGYGDILVEDLSRGGLAFRVVGQGGVEEGDLLDLQFQLDDPERTPVRVRVLVRHILDEKVGCEFVNLDPGMLKTISFYVLP